VDEVSYDDEQLASMLKAVEEMTKRVQLMADNAAQREDSDTLRMTRATLEVLLTAHGWLREHFTGQNPLGILSVDRAFDDIVSAIERGLETPA
jgi:stage III sporulation protein SpoIIIAA